MERLFLRITEWGGRCERRGDMVRATGVGLGWDFHEAGPVVLEGAGHTCPSEAATTTELMPRCCCGQTLKTAKEQFTSQVKSSSLCG